MAGAAFTTGWIEEGESAHMCILWGGFTGYEENYREGWRGWTAEGWGFVLSMTAMHSQVMHNASRRQSWGLYIILVIL